MNRVFQWGSFNPVSAFEHINNFCLTIILLARDPGVSVCPRKRGFPLYPDGTPGPLGAPDTRLKALTDLPVASGFGIADAETAAEAARHADGVISGSGFVKALGESVEKAASFVKALADGVVSVSAKQ